MFKNLSPLRISIVVLFMCLHYFSTTAQEYYVKQYLVEKGLPSDIIKGCAQDSLGYFWIATDEGLIKYDGIKFTSYREAMRSNYAKGFFTTKRGKLLAFGDLDLIEIKNQGDTTLFKSLCPVAHIANDSALTYPKLIFEDVHENLWVSESQSVVKLQGKSFRRYEFDIANRSPQFLRSFAFFEDQKHELFISSFQGNVFRYNTQADVFELLAEKFPPGVEFVSSIDNKLIIGSANGLWQAELLKDGGFMKPELKMKIPLISYVAAIPHEKYFISTRGSHHFIADFKANTFHTIPNSINGVNHVYVSKEHDIWISGNDGLIMMQENLFQRVNENVTDFIESITEDPVSGIIYYATSRTMYAFNPATNSNTVLLDMPDGYFQSLYFTNDGIWVANAFTSFLFANGKIKKQFDFSKDERFVTEITRGPLGNIWLTIPGNRHAVMIDSAYKVHNLSVPLSRDGVINVIREAPEGIYVASSGKSSYLYFKPKYDTTFQNISTPLNFSTRSEFKVTDLTSTGNIVWLASSEGLLKLDHHQIEKVKLGDHFTGLPIKSVQPHPGNKLLLSTAYGMVLYDVETGSHDLFNESSGLLSNTITNHGFFVSKDERVWIGTAKGLCCSTRTLTKLSITPTPKFIALSINGKNKSLQAEEKIDYGSFISMQISSITFPENELVLQYRILPNETWQTSTESELHFSSLTPGDHTLEVKAKKNGPYSWSSISRLSFTINKPIWSSWWFYLLCIVTAIILIASTYFLMNVRNAIKSKKLQLLIDERTNELRLSNEELVNLNQEKNSLIGIVAHDLKSPLKQIIGLLTIIKMTIKTDEETASYLAMIEGSATRLDKMIMKILDIDAIESKSQNVKMERINLSEIYSSVADRYDQEATKKKILIDRKIEPGVFVLADKSYTEQVLENLLSNAIKFSPLELTVHISLKIIDNKAVCEIRDEGPGLSIDDKKKLFGKYQKLSAQPTGDEVSTGLGLSIVKKFVHAMNGEIWCESEYGKGASFFISLTKTA